jgi:hypothetical protein
MEDVKTKCYEWVKDAIESSNNTFHIDCCKKLIELFVAKFDDSIKEAELLIILYRRIDIINYV